MPKVEFDPCEEGHPELAQLVDVSTLRDRLPRYRCPRCSTDLTFEDAIRNDERMKILADMPRLVGMISDIVSTTPLGAREAAEAVAIIIKAEWGNG